jgi:hypothetical protein
VKTNNLLFAQPSKLETRRVLIRRGTDPFTTTHGRRAPLPQRLQGEPQKTETTTCSFLSTFCLVLLETSQRSHTDTKYEHRSYDHATIPHKPATHTRVGVDHTFRRPYHIMHYVPWLVLESSSSTKQWS